MAGSIFETAVLIELEKTFLGRGLSPQLYFWRTSYGAEVDIVVDYGTNLIPIEVKLSATPRPAMASGLVKFKELFGKKVERGYLIHSGDMLTTLAPQVVALPFACL
jgi:predicted AAA+ superfamily ATPase